MQEEQFYVRKKGSLSNIHGKSSSSSKNYYKEFTESVLTKRQQNRCDWAPLI